MLSCPGLTAQGDPAKKPLCWAGSDQRVSGSRCDGKYRAAACCRRPCLASRSARHCSVGLRCTDWALACHLFSLPTGWADQRRSQQRCRSLRPTRPASSRAPRSWWMADTPLSRSAHSSCRAQCVRPSTAANQQEGLLMPLPCSRPRRSSASSSGRCWRVAANDQSGIFDDLIRRLQGLQWFASRRKCVCKVPVAEVIVAGPWNWSTSSHQVRINFVVIAKDRESQ